MLFRSAAQGIVAGINAALQAQNKPPMILDRASSYIGTLVDDLVTKGCEDPYRMMTSRSEYRLVLRQDNADFRLMPIGYKVGLLPEARYQEMLKKYELVETEKQRLLKTNVAPSDVFNKFLTEHETAPLSTGCKLADLIRRPQLNYVLLKPFDAERPDYPLEIGEQVEIQLKYEGYIEKQMAQIASENNWYKVDGQNLISGKKKFRLTDIHGQVIETSEISYVSSMEKYNCGKNFEY